MDKRIVLHLERCMGCHTCEIACAVAHSKSKDLGTILRTGERPGYRISVESYGRKAVPINCQHCEEPACVLACPTGAVHRKSDGAPVLLEEERCIGCRMCVQACPFGMMTVRPDGKGALKCDLCIERLAAGQEPACVASCPTAALTFEAREESGKSKRLKVAERIVAAEAAGAAESRGMNSAVSGEVAQE